MLEYTQAVEYDNHQRDPASFFSDCYLQHPENHTLLALVLLCQLIQTYSLSAAVFELMHFDLLDHLGR